VLAATLLMTLGQTPTASTSMPNPLKGLGLQMGMPRKEPPVDFATKFRRSEPRLIIEQLAKSLGKTEIDQRTVLAFLNLGLDEVEVEFKNKAWDNDVAAGVAFHICTIYSLARDKTIPDTGFTNLTLQLRKDLGTKAMAELAAAEKQAIYEYALGMSVYYLTMAASAKTDDQRALVKAKCEGALKTIFDTSLGTVVIDKNGLRRTKPKTGG
jgi:hypothetical protein